MYENNILFFIQLFICLYTFSAINFQGYCICHVSCYTLADSDFHGHCRDVLIQQHFLWYLIMSVLNLAHLKQRSEHPASHILLTKKCPQIEKRIQLTNVFTLIDKFTPI